MYKSNKLGWVVAFTLPLLLGVASVVPASAEIVVVVASTNKVRSLTAREVKEIFLKKNRTLPNGEEAKPINQPEDSEIYNQFAIDALDKDAAQLKSYWSVQVFSGMSSPPNSVDGDKAVIQRVASSPGAIGYIDSKSVDNSVKVVFTLGN